jgi:hypothetical protein
MPSGNLKNLTHMGKGRPRGSKNKSTLLFEMVYRVIKKKGGIKFFENMLEKDKHDFHMIVKEVMPKKSEIESVETHIMQESQLDVLKEMAQAMFPQPPINDKLA